LPYLINARIIRSGGFIFWQQKYLAGRKISLFTKRQAVLAVKDEYTFDFIDMADKHSDRQLESALVNNVRSFLLEMGPQFTFIGNQFKLSIDDKEYFIDFLLYHRELRCLVAIELKIGEFQPECKMEFYLSLLNDKVKLPHENDAIGIIICKEKNRTIVEYSLKTSSMPIGVSTYTTTAKLHKDYKHLLPDSKAISKKIDRFLRKIDTTYRLQYGFSEIPAIEIKEKAVPQNIQTLNPRVRPRLGQVGG
jgi:hypothetical protein